MYRKMASLSILNVVYYPGRDTQICDVYTCMTTEIQRNRLFFRLEVNWEGESPFGVQSIRFQEK